MLYHFKYLERITLKGRIMTVKPVLMIGNKILRKKSEEVDFKINNITGIIDDLKDTLHHLQRVKETGRAIAGVQIGYMKRIIYMESGKKRIIMINPKITNKSDKKMDVWDSCFSADVSFFGKTSRYKKINVEYYDEKKNKITASFENDLSELFQHEIDHLDGILFTDHIIDNQIIMRSEWEKLYK
jgi:peptide deformylase